MKGLKGVYVLVERLAPEVEKLGLTKEQLQTDVELQLRRNGIRVLFRKEWLLTSGSSCLYVNVNIITSEDNPNVAYNISLELKQDVFLVRDPTKMCYAATWTAGSTGTVGKSNITNIRKSVKNKVDIFSNDYLAANPKKQ